MAEVREAARLDPGGGHQTTLAWCLSEAGDLDAAMALYRTELEAHPDRLRVHTWMGMFYLNAGRIEEATREADCAIPPVHGVERFDHALLNALLGRTGPVEELYAAIERHEPGLYVSDSDRAMIAGALGQNELALDLLEKDAREGDRILWLYSRGLFFDSIRDDARFKALLREYRLPDRPLRRPRWRGPGVASAG